MGNAANFNSTFWSTPQGVAGYAGSRNFGILNAAGTHALAQNGNPIVYSTKKVAALVAPHAIAMAQPGGHHHWVPVFGSRAAAAASVK